MKSLKIKNRNFVKTQDRHCIAAIIALPEQGKWRIYVAWENPKAAQQGFMGFFKSDALFQTVDKESIHLTMDFGIDIGHTDEAKRVFKSIL